MTACVIAQLYSSATSLGVVFREVHYLIFFNSVKNFATLKHFAWETLYPALYNFASSFTRIIKTVLMPRL